MSRRTRQRRSAPRSGAREAATTEHWSSPSLLPDVTSDTPVFALNGGVGGFAPRGYFQTPEPQKRLSRRSGAVFGPSSFGDQLFSSPSPARKARFSNRHLIGYWLDDRTAHQIPAPAGSSVCARRSSRRRVIFALGKTGQGSRSKRVHLNSSQISCRSR